MHHLVFEFFCFLTACSNKSSHESSCPVLGVLVDVDDLAINLFIGSVWRHSLVPQQEFLQHIVVEQDTDLETVVECTERH